jgi:hypothetical protein
MPLSPAQPALLPWYVLVLMFYAAEVAVVHIQFRREVHTFSLSEIPFVIGLFFATPVDFVLANVIGAFGALLIHRRQAPHQARLQHQPVRPRCRAGRDPLPPMRGASLTMTSTEWFAALGATAAMNVIGIATIAAAIGLSEGRLEVPKLAAGRRFGLMVGMTNAVVVLAAITFLWNDPGAVDPRPAGAGALSRLSRLHLRTREAREPRIPVRVDVDPAAHARTRRGPR